MFNIYLVTNTVNGRTYVGVTKHTAEKRWRQHVKCARGATTRLFALQRAIRKYGPDAFTVVTIDTSSTWEGACALEIKRIAEQRLNPKGCYNLTSGGDGVPNISPDSLARLRVSLSKALQGHKLSAETKAKIGAANRGRKLSDEARRKLSASSLRVRKPLTPETRAKITASLTGKKRSPEAIAKMVAKNTGKKATAEHRLKVSEALKGRKFSDEHRRKISEAAKARCERARCSRILKQQTLLDSHSNASQDVCLTETKDP
jgi:group I intron endonuclease